MGYASPGVKTKEPHVWGEILWEFDVRALVAKQPNQRRFTAFGRLMKTRSKANCIVRVNPHQMTVESAIVKRVQAQAIPGIQAIGRVFSPRHNVAGNQELGCAQAR